MCRLKGYDDTVIIKILGYFDKIIPFEARFHGFSVKSGQLTSSTDISLKYFGKPLERAIKVNNFKHL